jgi:hypothetical protein
VQKKAHHKLHKKIRDMKKSEPHIPKIQASDSSKPVYHFEAHDGDWGEDDIYQWEAASKNLKDDLADWKHLKPEKHHGKLGGAKDNGHFFAH